MKYFNLLSQFLKELSFESPNVPELFFRQENSQAKMDIAIDIQVKGAENNLYMVDLLVKLHSKLESDEKAIFMIESNYSGLVQVANTESEEALKKILMIDVPTLLFPTMRDIILRITSESGFPPFSMQMVDFQALYDDKRGTEKIDDDFFENVGINEDEQEDNDCYFDFQQFVKETYEDLPKEDIENYESACGKLPDQLEDLIFYKNYLRFFKPIKYKTPEYLEEELLDWEWKILFQLLMGDISYEYRFEMGEGDDLPELLYKEDNDYSSWEKVSDLTGSGLKYLLDSLLICTMGESQELYRQGVNINTDLAEELERQDRIPTWEEFLAIYGIDEDSEAASTLHIFYNKLKEYDLKTCLYREQNEIDEIFEA
jgi:preprotein translocase subunit SecB